MNLKRFYKKFAKIKCKWCKCGPKCQSYKNPHIHIELPSLNIL
jgi:hypothetical protein